MSTAISIIGLGAIARVLATRALDGGNTVEVIGRDATKAAAFARSATAAAIGTVPVGDVVILAVPALIVSQYADALSGKVIVRHFNFSLGVNILS